MGPLEYLAFFLTLFLLLLLPGSFLLMALFGSFRRFTVFEAGLFSIFGSLFVLDFMLLGFDHFSLPITRASILIGLMVWMTTAVGALLVLFPGRASDRLFRFRTMTFTRREGALFTLLLVLTVAVKAVFLSAAIAPTATDLGHHMYWSKVIAASGAVPEYAKREIVEEAGRYRVSEPQPIDDFIVGEHLPFAALSLVSGADFVSAFPALTLFFIHLSGILAVVALAARLFGRGVLGVTPARAALWTLFFVGPLYAVASPQAKFVSGGVVGNMFGNFFIPLLLLAYYRAFRGRDQRFLALAFLGTLTLVYTHHLSTLVFLFMAGFTLIGYVALSWRRFRAEAGSFVRLVFRPWPLMVMIGGSLFFLLVAAPSYADPQAVDTALGAPSKTTRTGLSLIQLGLSAGYDRLGFGLLGLGVALVALRRRPLARVFLTGPLVAVLLMTLAPEWVKVDVPSNRVAAYAAFPLSLLAAAALAWLAPRIRHQTPAGVLLLLLLTFSFVSGWNDNAQSLPVASAKDQGMAETYAAADYLSRTLGPDDVLLKDHNYLTADTWMKLWFLRDYNYPFSRSLLGRYEDEVNPREQCTLHMIASPNRPEGVRCFEETGVNVVMVHPAFDSVQFARSSLFNLVYRSAGVAVYLRTPSPSPL